VLGTVGGVIGLLTIGALFIICNGRRKGHLREVFVDVSGSVFAAKFVFIIRLQVNFLLQSCSLAYKIKMWLTNYSFIMYQNKSFQTNVDS
jgi:hypothetical protein